MCVCVSLFQTFVNFFGLELCLILAISMYYYYYFDPSESWTTFKCGKIHLSPFWRYICACMVYSHLSVHIECVCVWLNFTKIISSFWALSGIEWWYILSIACISCIMAYKDEMLQQRTRKLLEDLCWFVGVKLYLLSEWRKFLSKQNACVCVVPYGMPFMNSLPNDI